VGDLKLAYAQFEELESFSRFGARLDEETRKVIEHGRRIRACLKQPEFSPVPVEAQIAVLLAMGAALFDPVPLERMKEAEQALQTAVASLPPQVRVRLRSPEKLGPQDRESILKIVRDALAPFQPQPAPQAKTEEPKPGPTPSKVNPQPEDAKKTKPEAKAENHQEAKPKTPSIPKPSPRVDPVSIPTPTELKKEPEPVVSVPAPAQAKSVEKT
jgi:F-type H+-transporting ATPase subunit alpha